MFYSHFLLSKKGPLGTVWIAAHLERRLRKSQVNETDIGHSVDSILYSEVPIALRLSGHLLLGVVRIYSRKVNYLYHDCNDALVKIKHAFRSRAVDLPAEAVRAPYHSITIPEVFDFGEIVFLPYQEESQSDVDLHVLERDRITLHDPFGEIFFVTPRLGAHEQITEFNLIGQKQDMESLFTIPQKDQISPMQPLEEDVLPPMAMDIEMDEDLDRTLEASFPNWMDRDERHITLPPIHVDQTLVHVSTTVIEPVDQTIQIEEGILADNILEVERVRSALERTYDEAYAHGLEEEVLISEKPLKLTDIVVEEAPLVEDKELPEQDKEQVPGLEVPLSPPTEVAVPPLPAVAVNKDYDVLASILGGTPAIHVAPTPIETPSPGHARETRRKRKPYFDLVAVLPVEQQTATTDTLRRRRRRVSVTFFDKCSADHFSKDIFPKASLYGLCPELCELYNKVTEIQREAVSPDGEAFAPQVEMDATATVGSAPEDADFRHPEDARGDIQPVPGAIEPVMFPLKPAWSELKEKGKHDNGLEIPIEDLRPGVIESTESITVSVGMEEVTVTPHKVQDQPKVVVPDAAFQTIVRPEKVQIAPTLQAEIPQSMDFGEDDEFKTASLSFDSSEPGLDFLADSIPQESSQLSQDVYLFEGFERIIPKVTAKDEHGWSSRTRAVVQYLQEAFKALQEQQLVASLSLENLLQNKTKKQAARMFFEIIVLKSQDYIGVEQLEPYSDIAITPRPKIMKSVF